MKSLKSLFLFGLFALLTFNACEKDNPNSSSSGAPSGNTNTNNTSSGTFTATVNGVVFSSNTINARIYESGSIIIDAYSGKKWFSVLISSPSVGPHTVTIVGGDYTNGVAYIPDTLNHYAYISDANSIINITAYNANAQTIAGNFNLMASDTLGNKVQITQGNFNIKYRTVGGTLNYTVDGQSHSDIVRDAFKYYTPLYDSLGNQTDSIYVVTIQSDYGSGNTYPRLNLVLPANLPAGTYAINYSTSLKYFHASLSLTNQDWYYTNDFKNENSGTLTITQNSSGVVSGTFTLDVKGYDSSTSSYITKTITNGSFDVKY